MTDREHQCPACLAWGGPAAEEYDEDDYGGGRGHIRHCLLCDAEHHASLWPSRAVVSSLIASMAAAAERRLAQALRADVRRHWRQMRAGRQVPGLLSASFEVRRDGVGVRLWSSDVEHRVPTRTSKTLTLTLDADSPLATRIHEQAWSGSYVVIPEVGILSRWLLESVEARSPHAVTMILIESHEE